MAERDATDGHGPGDDGGERPDEPSLDAGELDEPADAGSPAADEDASNTGAGADEGGIAPTEASVEQPREAGGGEMEPAESSWEPMPGTARDIAVGANGDLWVVGSNTESAGHSVHKWVEGHWVHVASEGAERIAVDPAGAPWIVSQNGTIMRRGSNATDDAAWIEIPGCAVDIGIGSSGDVWSIQCADDIVYKWDGSAWLSSGSAVFRAARVAVAPDGRPWVTDLGERVFRRTSTQPDRGGWEYLHGTGARDIAIAPDGSATIVSDVIENDGFSVKLLNQHGAWVPMDGAVGAHNIAVNARVLWITDATSRILRRGRPHEQP